MDKVDSWGYEHPDVVGKNALMFFMWDLSRTIEVSFKEANNIEDLEEMLPPAQAAIDALIQKYIDLKAAPDLFEGQSIRIAVEKGSATQMPSLALKTSPHLEEKIIAMQMRTQTGHA